MAELKSIVCDVCGKAATDTIVFRVHGGGVARQKDLCRVHLREVLKGSTPPRRGRPRAKNATTVRRRPTKKKPTARKRRTPRAQTTEE